MGLGCIGNDDLICELECEIGTSVILYTVDGFAYYGELQKILDKKAVVLGPGKGQTDVIVRLPDQTFCPQGTGIIRESVALIDLCVIAAKTPELTEIPLDFTFIGPVDG
ncbi:MAG TPA: hypothetical protein PKA28_18155 [Methylomusa anaerophila]|uniref:Uncharacterized protein n=1 Tax=Methylomusa anaerophila TaxID=1930071 RepID=A0A348AH75_9FIRM|nr:hypothetical protein [Methylomusa anaerophila]BBB90423.1 hypothetical protein MAMMFC1_01074 [Methylomusa anaerophila]HML90362.1 hypothetical protein [Methylomusa anaerophila]